MTDRQRLTWLQTFFRRVISLSKAPLVLLAPEWTVVKRALCRWCSHWFSSHASSRAWCRWRTPGWRCQQSLLDVVVVEDVGLIVRGVLSAKVPTSSFAEAHRGLLSLRTDPHGRWRWRSGKWKGRWEGRWRVQNGEVRTNAAHEAWMTWCGQPSWANVMCHIEMSVVEHEKMWRLRVFCSHLPSVAADCYQL